MNIIEEIRKNEERKSQLENELREVKTNLYNIGREYSKFFSKNENYAGKTEFKYYEALPSIEQFKTYMKYSAETNRYGDSKHPLQNLEYTYFNFEELAVLLKIIYEIKTGKEYGIVTTGNMVEWLFEAYPELYYIVGEKNKLGQYEEHNGVFYEKKYKLNFLTVQKGLIVIPHMATARVFDNFYKHIPNKEKRFSRSMKYFEYESTKQEATAYFLRQKDIFKNVQYRLDEINSHRDLFIMKIAQNDNFISQIIYSIMIYKMNNGIRVLTDNDYREIIYSLYHENIESITSLAKSEIAQELEYVKDESVRARAK